MALNFASAIQQQQQQLSSDDSTHEYDYNFDDALILNNHYDTDGVLSVWTCLVEPDQALSYSNLLREGAEAGDFGEWSSDNGIKLDCAIESFLGNNNNNEEEAYQQVLTELPDLLRDLIDTGGESYQALWKQGSEQAVQDYREIQDGNVLLEKGPGKMVIVVQQQQEDKAGQHRRQEERRLQQLSPYALHRGLIDSGLAYDGTTRILLCFCETTTNASADETSSSPLYHYRYQLPGHGWVQKLVDRPIIPPVDDVSALIKELVPTTGPAWRRSSSGSLVGVCETTQAIECPPNEIASLLHQLDNGCQ